jgi:hypothetical protein
MEGMTPTSDALNGGRTIRRQVVLEVWFSA